MLHVWSPEEGTRQACTALECAQLLPRESQAARGTPEEDTQATAMGAPLGPLRKAGRGHSPNSSLEKH